MDITIKDIAQRAKVSVNTVSLVLNGRNKGIRKDAALRAEKIINIAEEMGYQINNSARAIRTGKTNYIGLIRPADLKNAYLPSGLFNGISEELGRHKLHMQILPLPEEKKIEGALVPDYLRSRLVDGALINYVGQMPTNFQSLLDKVRLPAIYINRQGEYDCVYQDEIEAGFKATEFLIKRGFQKIAFVKSGRSEEHYSITDRFAGYRMAMEKAGRKPLLMKFPLGRYLNPTAPDSGEKIYTAYKSLNSPDAFVVYGKVHAELLYNVLLKAGELSSASKLNIVTFPTGFDWTGMPFLYMIQPEWETGWEAVKMLLRKIANGNKPLKSMKIPYVPELRCNPCFCDFTENGVIKI